MSGALPTEYFSPMEFARLTGLSLSTVHRRIRDKSLPVLQLGGPRTAIRIPRAALLRAHEPPSSSEPPAPSLTEAPPKRRRGPRPRWV